MSSQQDNREYQSSTSFLSSDQQTAPQQMNVPAVTVSIMESPNPGFGQFAGNRDETNILTSMLQNTSTIPEETSAQIRSQLMLTPKKSTYELSSLPAATSTKMLSPKMDESMKHMKSTPISMSGATAPIATLGMSTAPIVQENKRKEKPKPSLLAALLEAKSDPTPESSKLSYLASMQQPQRPRPTKPEQHLMIPPKMNLYGSGASNRSEPYRTEKQVSHEHIRRLLETHAPRSPPPPVPSAPPKPLPPVEETEPMSFSKSVDVVIDQVAHGTTPDLVHSWIKRKPPMDPALKQVQAAILAEKKQAEMLRKSTHTVQRFPSQTPPPPQQHRFNPHPAQQQQIHQQQQGQQRQYQYQQQVQQSQNFQKINPQQQTQFQQRGQCLPQGGAPISPQKNQANMRHVQLLAAPRGLLPVPPGIVQQSSADDHKFKKPLLPVKHRKQSQDEEKKRKENLDDVQRVQRHLMEAKRASQEAAAAKLAKQANNPPKTQPKPLLPPPPPENVITEEMVQTSNSERVKICLNGEIIDVHNALIHSKLLLKMILNKRTFSCLSPEGQNYLVHKFLPPEAQINLEGVLDIAFKNDPRSVHGNPLDLLHVKLSCGHFHAEKISDVCNLRDTQKILYDHYIRMYHMKLLKKLIVSRHLLLSHYDAICATKIDNPGPAPLAKDVIAEKRLGRALKRRADRRTKMMLTDCRQKAGEQGVSSDEEGDVPIEPINKALQVTLNYRSTLYNSKFRDLDLWQPVKVDDVKTMLKKYKRFKRHHPKSPSLDIRGIKLDDVFERAGLLAQSKKIRETAETLEKNLHRPIDPASSRLFM